MAEIAYLRTHYNQEGAQRVMDDVEQAVAAGVELGDRRPMMNALTSDLHRNYERLLSAVVELRATDAGQDPTGPALVKAAEEACSDLLRRLGPMLGQADRLNALLAETPFRDAAEPEPLPMETLTHGAASGC